MAMTLFTLYAGSLITRELFDIPLLGPAPFVSYEYYSIRTPVIPLSIFGLIFIINRRFFIGGLLIGLATFFHIKFGFRFFGLLFFSLLLWKLWGSKRFLNYYLLTGLGAAFLHFLVILPILGSKEKTLDVPLSLTEPVLGGSTNESILKNKKEI